MDEHQHQFDSEKCISMTLGSRTPQEMRHRSLTPQTPQTTIAMPTLSITPGTGGENLHDLACNRLRAVSEDPGRLSGADVYDLGKQIAASEGQLHHRVSENTSPMTSKVTIPGTAIVPFFTIEKETQQAMSDCGQTECSKKDVEKPTTSSTSIPASVHGVVTLQDGHSMVSEVDISISKIISPNNPGEDKIKAGLRGCVEEVCSKIDDKVKVEGVSPVSLGVAYDMPHVERVQVGSSDIAQNNSQMEEDFVNLIDFPSPGQLPKQSLGSDIEENFGGQLTTQKFQCFQSSYITHEEDKQLPEYVFHEITEGQTSSQGNNNSKNATRSPPEAKLESRYIVAQHNGPERDYHTKFAAKASVNRPQQVKRNTGVNESQSQSKQKRALPAMQVVNVALTPISRELESPPRDCTHQENTQHNFLETQIIPVPEANGALNPFVEPSLRDAIDLKKEQQAVPHMPEPAGGFAGLVDMHRRQTRSQSSLIAKVLVEETSLGYIPPPKQSVAKKTTFQGFIPDSSDEEVVKTISRATKDSGKSEANCHTSNDCTAKTAHTRDFSTRASDNEESKKGDMSHKVVRGGRKMDDNNDSSNGARSAKVPPKLPAKESLEESSKSTAKPPTKKAPAKASAKISGRATAKAPERLTRKAPAKAPVKAPVQRAAKTKRTERFEPDSSEFDQEPKSKKRQIEPISDLQKLGGNIQRAIDLDGILPIGSKQSFDNLKKVPRNLARHPRFQHGEVYVQIAGTEPSKYCYSFGKLFLSHISPWFSDSIDSDIEEPDHDLAEHMIQDERWPYNMRFEMVYSKADDFWILQRASLTKLNSKNERRLEEDASINLASLQSSNSKATTYTAARPAPVVPVANRYTNISVVIPPMKTAAFDSSLDVSSQDSHSSTIMASHKYAPNNSVDVALRATFEEDVIMADAGDMLEGFGSKKNNDSGNDEASRTQVKVEDMTDYEKSRPFRGIISTCESLKQGDEDQPIPSIPEDNLVKTLARNSVGDNIIAGTGSKRSGTAMAVTQGKKPIPLTKCGIPVIICEAYNNLFLIFHGMLPKLGSFDIDVAFMEAEMLAKAASAVECFDLASPHIYSCLYNFGERMYASIFEDPPRWLKMSCALKSGPIFKAAMTHIVGRYPYWPWASVRNDQLPGELRTLIRQKVDELSGVKASIDSLLFTSTLAVGGQGISFFNLDESSFNSWFIIQCWRDWFCHTTAQTNAANLKHKSYAKIYRLIAQGGGAYLPLASVLGKLRELKGNSLTPKDMEEAAKDLRVIKEYAAEQVKPLCVNRSMLDVDEYGITYFTCVTIADFELPWASHEVMDEA